MSKARRVRVILQARTTSGRLPAKVLLPLGGFPLAVLCGKRLENTGLDVVLATSIDESDDALARLAASGGLQVCRGSLDDVLSRFVGAVEDMTDNDIIVRATADNPLPDGGFVDALLEMFIRQDLHYFGTNPPSDGLPHGLSAEVCAVGALRQRGCLATTPFEREHVTPALRERSATSRLLEPGSLVAGNYSHLQCSVDTLDDYLHMDKLFDQCVDPIGMPWPDLLTKLPITQPRARGGTDAGQARRRD